MEQFQDWLQGATRLYGFARQVRVRKGLLTKVDVPEEIKVIRQEMEGKRGIRGDVMGAPPPGSRYSEVSGR
jgi:hypothetical protein